MEPKQRVLAGLRQDVPREHAIVRTLVENGDPDTLQTGLLSLGWPSQVAVEQANSMRLGLEPAGIERQIMDLARQYRRESPGPYETILGNKYGRKPSLRQTYRSQSQ